MRRKDKYQRTLLEFISFGTSQITRFVYFKELVEKFEVIHVTEGLSPEQGKMMNFTYSPDLQDAIQTVSKSLPQASVAIFPSGGNSIPEVPQKIG